jgi:hypothetical protein
MSLCIFAIENIAGCAVNTGAGGINRLEMQMPADVEFVLSQFAPSHYSQARLKGLPPASPWEYA